MPRPFFTTGRPTKKEQAAAAAAANGGGGGGSEGQQRDTSSKPNVDDAALLSSDEDYEEDDEYASSDAGSALLNRGSPQATASASNVDLEAGRQQRGKRRSGARRGSNLLNSVIVEGVQSTDTQNGDAEADERTGLLAKPRTGSMSSGGDPKRRVGAVSPARYGTASRTAVRSGLIDGGTTSASDGEAAGSSFGTSPGFPRLFRVGSTLGSTPHGQPHFLQLNAPLEERALRRNASLFRLTGLIDDRSGEYELYRKSPAELKEIKSKKVRAFYKEQNAVLDAFKEVDEILDNTRVLAATGGTTPLQPAKPSAGAEEQASVKIKLAINVNFALNIVLLIAKVVVATLSHSVSLIASAVDSAMDFLSTAIIFSTNRLADRSTWKTRYEYPVGRRRMEPIGVVVFSIFMISSFIQVFAESVQRLLRNDAELATISTAGLIIVVITIASKLVMWFWCRTIKSTSVQALAQDAENDVVFNFFSLLFPFIGQLLSWKYLDPIGGVLLSLYIIVEWLETLVENVVKLCGRRASPQEHQRVAYMVSRFSPLISAIQHLRVYHQGDHLVVEVDVVLPQSTALPTAHNLAESCQYGLEQLEGIERAYVHVDVSVNPLSGHVDRG